MKKKDIIIFCPFLARGGLEKSVVNIANYLDKKHQVTLITNSRPLKNLNKLNNKIRLINLSIPFLYSIRILNNFFCVLYTILILKKNSIIFSLQEPFFLLLLKSLNFNFKLAIRTPSAIINGKNKYEEKNIKLAIKNKNFFISFYKYADLIITSSKDNKIFFEKKIGSKNVVTMNNFFPKKKLFIKPKKHIKNIFFIGRLTWDKNPIFFLESLIPLLNKKNFNIHIVGDGPEYNRLIQIAEKYKNRVKFHGFIKDPFKKFAKKIDIFSINSRYDGTPNVMGEAMSFKIPCIAPKKVGLTDIFLARGRFGVLYEPDNKLDFQKKIIHMLNNYRSYTKKANLAYKSLDRFNLQNTLGKTEKFLSKI